MCKISVILPVFNGEKYVAASIESIINQTFTDWELIIVDDCSTDDSLEVIKKYVLLDNRITVVHNSTNKRLPESLNEGFSRAEGEYLTWTSDDNIYLSNAFKTMNDFLDSNYDCSMVCTKMLFVNDEKKVIRESDDYSFQKMLSFNLVGASFMYRRSVMELIGNYDVNLFCVEDYDYWIRILEHNMKIKYLPGCFYLYRIHEESLTITKRSYHAKQHRIYFKKHSGWLKEKIDDSIELFNVYNDLLSYAMDDFYEFKELFNEIDEISMDVEPPPDCEYVLYGAGKVGVDLLEVLKDKVYCFLDTDVDKTGKEVLGKKILSLEDIIDMIESKQLHIIVSVGRDKLYETTKCIINCGIKNFSLPGHLNGYT